MIDAADEKDLYEHLEVLHRHIEGTTAEASFDAVINALAYHPTYTVSAAVRFFQNYRTDTTPQIGFRGPAYDEPI